MAARVRPRRAGSQGAALRDVIVRVDGCGLLADLTPDEARQLGRQLLDAGRTEGAVMPTLAELLSRAQAAALASFQARPITEPRPPPQAPVTATCPAPAAVFRPPATAGSGRR